MSSVNPSDTYNGYYIKHLSDFEDELKADYKNREQNSRERVEDLSQKYEENTRKTNERASESVDQIREDMSDHYARSRESDRNELEQLKKQNYDRFGRDRSNEADNYRERLEEANRTIESERTGHQARVRDMESAGDRRAEALSKQYEDHLDKAIEAEHSSAQNTLEELHLKQKGAAEAQREEAAHKYDILSQARMDDQTDNRRRTETLITDGKRDMDNLSLHLNSAIDQRLAKDHQSGVEREEANAQRLKDSHDLQSQDLREQVRTLLAKEGQAPKDRAQARSEAIRDYEDEWRGRMSAMDDAHQKEITKLHTMADESDKQTSRSGDDRMRERDAYFTNLITKQGQETRDEHNAIIGRYESAIKEMDTRARKDKDFSEQRIETTLRGANEDRETALKIQAENFQRSGAVQKQNDQDSIDALQKALAKKTNVTDEQDISPAVENAVRRSIVAQYAKNLNAEIERNKQQADSSQRSYSERLQNAQDENQNTLSAREHAHATEMHQNESTFVAHIQDTEVQKDEALRRSQQDHDRQTETLSHVYSQAQVKQRNDYDSIIQNIKDDASSRIQATKQESEFALKQQQRAFSVRENEMIRDYEKRIADQKTDYETRLDDIRIQAQQATHDIERRDKQTYDDQTRSYDQRIAQMEEKHQERERNISQNYDDQLDKVKRSNQLLQSKKSLS